MTMNRRTLLEGLGLGAAAQLLPTLRPAYAQNGIPVRLVIFYSHHGTLPWLWMPTGTRTNFTLGPMLEPLASWKNDLILLSGIDCKALDVGKTGNCGHATGQMGSLTAHKQTGQKSAAGPSIDAFIASELTKKNNGVPPTLHSALRWRILDRLPNLSLWGFPYQSQDAAGKITPIPLEYQPAKAYQAAFKDFKGMPGMNPGGSPDLTNAKRKTVLDWVTKEFGAVGNKLGKFEQDRLESHAAKLRDFQSRLQVGGVTGGSNAACTPMTMASSFKDSPGQSGYWANTSDAFPRLMQLALACDISRIVCLQVEEPAPSTYGYTPGNFGTNDLHDLVHKLDVGRKDQNNADHVRISRGYFLEHAKLYAKVLQLLAEVKEADGKRLLDHTIVLWAGEIAQPGHSYCNHKWVMAGSGGGQFKTGQFLNWDGDSVKWGATATNPSNGDLFTSIANAMGVNIAKFGEPTTTKGPIAELKG